VHRDARASSDAGQTAARSAGKDGHPEAEWRFLRLHVETAVVLQIALATGEFRPGRYVREGARGGTWKRAEDRP